MGAGQDATDEFEAIHSAKAKSQLMEFVIGKVGDKSSAPATEKLAEQSAKVCLQTLHVYQHACLADNLMQAACPRVLATLDTLP